VDDQLAEQDAEGDVGGDLLAAVEGERRRRAAVGPHLGGQRGQVAPQPGGQLLPVEPGQRLDLGVVQRAEVVWVRDPGAAPLGAGRRTGGSR
jgi:hypothetical protein